MGIIQSPRIATSKYGMTRIIVGFLRMTRITIGNTPPSKAMSECCDRNIHKSANNNCYEHVLCKKHKKKNNKKNEQFMRQCM